MPHSLYSIMYVDIYLRHADRASLTAGDFPRARGQIFVYLYTYVYLHMYLQLFLIFLHHFLLTSI